MSVPPSSCSGGGSSSDASSWRWAACSRSRFGGRRALLLIERNLLVYRSGWLMIVSGFFEPLFYLLSIGLGIGGLVGDVPGPDGEPIPYALFVAPALLATASMNGAITESTFNVFFKLNYQKIYDAVLATPMAPGDVALGEIGWAVIRSTLYALGFMVVILVLGLVRLAVGGVRGPGRHAARVRLRRRRAWPRRPSCARWQDFDLINLVILPLFLFSGTFYPITAYPEPLQIFVQLTPLWQGTDMIRALVTGYVDPSILWHVGVPRRRWASSGSPWSAGASTGCCSSRPAGPLDPARRRRRCAGAASSPFRRARYDRPVPTDRSRRRGARGAATCPRSTRPSPTATPARASSPGARSRRASRSPASATRPTGDARSRASATRWRGSCSWASRPRRTAPTGPAASSRATPRATSCGGPSTPSASRTGR